jgi:hypothetical protein
MKRLRQFRWMKAAVILMLISSLPSCAYLETLFGSSPPPNPSTNVTGNVTTTQNPLGPVFYDFVDIPIPRELSFVPRDSYVFEAGKTKTGFIVLRGRVEVISIIRFFKLALPREGWNKKGSLQSGRSVLIFEKPAKACIINIYERNLLTYVEIYVIPYDK